MARCTRLPDSTASSYLCAQAQLEPRAQNAEPKVQSSTFRLVVNPSKLDNYTLIFDRLDADEFASVLKTISLQ
jgi:hypothetical protein